jgi:hypothetical protein
VVTNNSINSSMPVTVPDGGTGAASITAYAVVCGGTTATAALQPIAGVGTEAQVLTSNGAATLPTFQDIDGAYDLATTGPDTTISTAHEKFLSLVTRMEAGSDYTARENLFISCPICVGTTINTTQVGVYNDVAVVDKSFRWAIYENSAGDTGTRLLESGVISSATTGYKWTALTHTFTPGLYWFAISSDSNSIKMYGTYSAFGAFAIGASSFCFNTIQYNFDFAELPESHTFIGESLFLLSTPHSPYIFYQ